MGMRVNANEQETQVPFGPNGTGPPPRPKGEAATKEGRRPRIAGNDEREKKRKKRGEDTRTGKEGERGAPEKADNPPLVQRKGRKCQR
jgi:hypothetical protein